MKKKSEIVKRLESVLDGHISARIQIDSSEEAYRQINKISFGENFKALIGNFKSDKTVIRANQSSLL